MGTVSRVVDEVNGRGLALKRLLAGDGDANFAHRAALFEREYHALVQLRHPHIVAVYDYGLEGKAPYYTMELLLGKDLRNESQVPWRPLCVLLCEIASALALIHSRGLVHRDVTPRNI